MPEDNRYFLAKVGSAAAILGSLCAAIGNILHPITPRDDPLGVAQVIADSDTWTAIHLVIIVGTLLMLGGLIGLRYTIERGLPGALVRLGVYAATVGTTIGLITVALDGVVAKQLANAWARAPAVEQPLALALVSTNETLNFGLAGLFNSTFAGVPYILFGLAIALGDTYPRWLGWLAVAAGLGSIGAGTHPGLHWPANHGFARADHHRADGHRRLDLQHGHPARSLGRPARCIRARERAARGGSLVSRGSLDNPALQNTHAWYATET
jgi:hypothetical protein